MFQFDCLLQELFKPSQNVCYKIGKHRIFIHVSEQKCSNFNNEPSVHKNYNWFSALPLRISTRFTPLLIVVRFTPKKMNSASLYHNIKQYFVIFTIWRCFITKHNRRSNIWKQNPKVHKRHKTIYLLKLFKSWSSLWCICPGCAALFPSFVRTKIP